MLSSRVLLCFAALVVLVACAATSVSASTAADFRDCESCVENGWGWSWSKSACGGFLNTNCDPDSAEAQDEEEDEDFSAEAASKAQIHTEESVPFEIPPPASLPSEPLEWANTEQTTHLWQLANNGDIQSLAAWTYREPLIVHLRSEDGRGALFWANEYEKWEMIDFLLERGADAHATDATGNMPSDMLPAGARRPKNVQTTLNKEQAKQQAGSMQRQ